MSIIKKEKEFFDSLAPTWDSFETMKEEDLLKVLSNLPDLKGKKVLDIGCGTGVITPLLASKSGLPVLGIDLSSKMIEIAKQKYKNNACVSFLNANFLEYEGPSFDYAVIYNAYPHFLKPDDLARALDKHVNEGFAIIHSLGRKGLVKCHEGNGNELSRHLLSPKEEAKFFEPYFELVKSNDDENHYALYFQKKTPRRV